MKSSWFNISKISKKAKVLLFCFPYGGGGASTYAGWQEKMDPRIAVVPMQLPGSESRIKEPPIETMQELILQLEHQMSPKLALPFALYGHSLGGLVAYELAQMLSKKKTYEQHFKHLFIGGCSAPHFFAHFRDSDYLNRFQDLGFQEIPTKEELIDCSEERMDALVKLLRMDFAKYEVLKKDREFFILIIGKMLADLRIIHSYELVFEKPLAIPLTVFHGKKDDRLSLTNSKAWKKYTTGPFKLHLMAGDHFFLRPKQQQTKLVHLINQILLKEDKGEFCNS